MIVTVSPTATDGTAVRWFESYAKWTGRNAILSASRHGVYVHGWLDRIPDELIDKANDAHQILKAHRHANVDHFATHEVRNGDLVALPGSDQCVCLGSCRKLDCDCVCHGGKGE